MQSTNHDRTTTRRQTVVLIILGVLAVALIGAGGYGMLRGFSHRETPPPAQQHQIDVPNETPDHSVSSPTDPQVTTPDSAPVQTKDQPEVPTPDTKKKSDPATTSDPNLTEPPTDNTIFAAAYTGDINALRKLLKKTPGLLDARDPVQGATPLLWATVKGRKAAVHYLLSRGAKVNARGQGGWTPLHRAAYGGYTDLVKVLLAKGADINATDGRNGTALLKAAGRGHLDTVKVLLARHPKLDVQEKDAGLSALHAAIMSKRKDVVTVLLAAGVNVNLKAKDGGTPLIYAQATGQEEVISLLQKAGAKE